MPWTFSHPLAVIPVHGLFRGRLDFAGLTIGSLSPDFAYYGKQFPLATLAHTLPGTFFVCLPSGLVALALFYALRPALCFILPQPHRAALTPFATVRPRLSLRNLGIAAGSVLLGAWSHTIWDSFTHHGGWAVERIPILGKPLISIADTPFSLSYLLQQGSTFGAAAMLAFLYFRWLRRQSPSLPDPSSERPSDRWRYFLLGAISFIAILVAAPLALQMASRHEGYLAFRVFLFRAGVYSTMAFFPLLVICSVTFHSRFNNHRG